MDIGKNFLTCPETPRNPIPEPYPT